MFEKPKSTNFAPPPSNIDVDERILFKLTKLTDEGVSKFADPAKGETFHNLAWHMQAALASTKAPFFNADGTPWEHVEFTTSKTGKNPKSGMVARARTFIEAFLGHQVEDDEINAELPNQLLGRYATGFFEYVDRQAQDGSTYQKLQIAKLSPYKGGAEPAPEPKPAPAAAAQADIPF